MGRGGWTPVFVLFFVSPDRCVSCFWKVVLCNYCCSSIVMLCFSRHSVLCVWYGHSFIKNLIQYKWRFWHHFHQVEDGKSHSMNRIFPHSHTGKSTKIGFSMQRAAHVWFRIFVGCSDSAVRNLLQMEDVIRIDDILWAGAASASVHTSREIHTFHAAQLQHHDMWNTLPL